MSGVNSAAWRRLWALLLSPIEAAAPTESAGGRPSADTGDPISTVASVTELVGFDREAA